MDDRLVKEGSLKLYEESIHVWDFNESPNAYDKLQNDQYLESPTFPEVKSKWKGIVTISIQNSNVYVNLQINASESIHIKSYLLLLRQNDTESESYQEINVSEDKEKYQFKIVNTLLVHCILGFWQSFKIKVIIQEEITEIQKSALRTNSGHRIKGNKNLKNDLKMMFENKEFSDFVIKLEDSSEISVHKNILASRSPVFSVMLKSDFLEENETCIKITDIDKDTMMMLLNYVYTENLASDLSVEKVTKLLSAADKYDMSDLKQLCCEYLEKNLKISHDIEILAELYNVPELKKCIIDLILDHKEKFADPIILEKIEKHFPKLLPELITEMFNFL